MKPKQQEILSLLDYFASCTLQKLTPTHLEAIALSDEEWDDITAAAFRAAKSMMRAKEQAK